MSANLPLLRQRLCDPSAPLSHQLAEARILAVRARCPAIKNWLGDETHGYAEGAVLPVWRQGLVGQVVIRSPHYGWVLAPLDPREHQRLSQSDLYAPVHEIEARLADAHRRDKVRHPLPPPRLEAIRRAGRLSVETAVMMPAQAYWLVLQQLRASLAAWLDAVHSAGPAIWQSAEGAFGEIDQPPRYWQAPAEDVADALQRESAHMSRRRAVFGWLRSSA